MSGFEGSPPAWHPDPLRRHEFRYWDGTTWTARVSDAGQLSADPFDGVVGPAAAAGADGDNAPAAPPPARGRVSTPRLVVIGSVAAVVVVGGLFAFRAVREGDGTGTSSGSIDSTGDIAVHEVELSEGDMVRVLLTPEEGFAASMAVGTTLETLAAFDFSFGQNATISFNPAADSFFSSADEDIACDVASEDLGDDPGSVRCRGGSLVVLFDADERGAGQQQYMTFIAPASGTYSVLVRGENGSQGTFRLRVDRAATGD